MYSLQRTSTEIIDRTTAPIKLPLVKSKPTTIEHVYHSYLRCVADVSQLDLRLNNCKTPQHVLTALMEINDILVKQVNADAVDLLNVIKLFAEERPDKSIIVYTGPSVYTFDLLKRIPNVTPVKYGDEFYSHIIHMPIDYILLLPQKKQTGSFENVIQLAQQLSDNQQYIPITKINIIGLGADLEQYAKLYSEYVNAANGKIIIKNENGDESVVEIK